MFAFPVFFVCLVYHSLACVCVFISGFCLISGPACCIHFGGLLFYCSSYVVTLWSAVVFFGLVLCASFLWHGMVFRLVACVFWSALGLWFLCGRCCIHFGGLLFYCSSYVVTLWSAVVFFGLVLCASFLWHGMVFRLVASVFL